MLGLSSAQLFPGMDQTNDERKGKQAQQLREWCAAQIADKEKAKTAEANAERYTPIVASTPRLLLAS